MPSVYGAIDLQKNEIRNAVVQNLGSAPSSPTKGQLYFNSTGGDNTLYWYDGSGWVPAKASSTLPLSNSANDLVVGGASAGGASTNASKGDHVHALPGWGAINYEPNFGASKSDGSAGTFARSDHSHGTPIHDAAAHATIPLSALSSASAAISMGGFKLNNLGAPVATGDAANKQYVDNIASGIDAKPSVRAATTGNITLSSSLIVDGIDLATNDRLLVKNQTNPADNGIYLVNTGGAYTRVTDMDAWTEVPSAFVFVEQGTVNADTGWVVTADQGGTLGTTAITWTQFSAAGAAIAGAGLTKAGNTIDVVAGDTTLTVTADSVVVNTGVIATRAYVDSSAPAGLTKKFAAALTGTASPETVTHNLNTRDIHLQVLNGSSPYTSVEVDWDATTVNTAVIRYSPNLGAGYRVVVIG